MTMSFGDFVLTPNWTWHIIAESAGHLWLDD
jgi:gentisate 1,2-dioxygenase